MIGGTGRLNLGVVGLGTAFRNLHLPNIARHRYALNVVGVVSGSAASAQAGAELIGQVMDGIPSVYPDIHALLASDVDVVLLNVPIARTHSMARAILAAGVNLICEKPLGEDAAEAAELVLLAEERQVLLAVCENCRYQERFHQVRDIVGNGAIGEPKMYFLNDLHFASPSGKYSSRPWRQQGSHRGGYVVDSGVHTVAGMRAMVGEAPTSVSVLSASFHPERLGNFWDAGLVNLTFASGLIGHAALGYGAVDRESRHPKLLGTLGTVALLRDRIEIWRPGAVDDEIVPLGNDSDGVSEEWDDFLSALRRGTQLRFSAWEAVADLEIIDAIRESARSGAPTPVNIVGGNGPSGFSKSA